MKVINPSFSILLPYPSWTDARLTMYQMIEKAGRTCYKSENNITNKSAVDFVKRIIKSGHEAMIEHVGLTVKFVVDRGVSHEIVRHRVASFAQESTRYCNYGKDKFGHEITVIKPCFFAEGSPEYDAWYQACKQSEDAYFKLLDMGACPQEARSVLPNSLKTELVMTANMREWRHFLSLRAVGSTGLPHPQMAEVAMPLLKELQKQLPELFGNIKGRD